MFESGMTLKAVIEEIKSEVDTASEIPEKAYIDWANAVEQLLYADIIREQRSAYASPINEDTADSLYSYPETPSDTDKMRFEDIYTVYIIWGDKKRKQLIKTTETSGCIPVLNSNIFTDCYHKCVMENQEEYLCIVSETDGDVVLIYIARPELKNIDNYSEKTVKLPPEFIDLMKSKLRGEAYKLVNEDSLAAKWLNDYNILLEQFKTWIEARRPQFGI